VVGAVELDLLIREVADSDRLVDLPLDQRRAERVEALLPHPRHLRVRQPRAVVGPEQRPAQGVDERRVLDLTRERPLLEAPALGHPARQLAERGRPCAPICEIHDAGLPLHRPSVRWIWHSVTAGPSRQSMRGSIQLLRVDPPERLFVRQGALADG
jgi:hypothetical protein